VHVDVGLNSLSSLGEFAQFESVLTLFCWIDFDKYILEPYQFIVKSVGNVGTCHNLNCFLNEPVAACERREDAEEAAQEEKEHHEYKPSAKMGHEGRQSFEEKHANSD